MGTWGDGIYDNDSALDELADLVELDAERSAAEVVAQIGLLAWLKPVAVTVGDGVRGPVASIDPEALARLPEATREALAALLADPEAATDTRARSKAATSALGGYSSGPRIDALLRFPGAQPVIDELAARASERLDRALGRASDLYEIAGRLAALGVVIELADAGFSRPPEAQVHRWRAGFEQSNHATKEERRFWSKYVRRVRIGLDLLAPALPEAKAAKAAKKPAKKAARRRAPPAPALPEGPLERFQHPKFGAGTLIARTRMGDDEALDLRFDDGSLRRILSRFVTAIAE